MTDSSNRAYLRRARRLRRINRIAIYSILVLFALWILVPFSVILSTSFKTWQEANTLGFSFFPKKWTLLGYTQALNFRSFSATLPLLAQGFLNTFLFVVPTTVIGLLLSSISGYAFAKIKYRGKNVLFSMMIFTMLIPGTVMIAPSYVMFDTIGWTGTPWPIIVPGMFGAAAAVFFMRQFYSGIPTDLVEAARVDGMGHLGIFFKIMVPLSKPALIAQGILGLMNGYNDYFGPYIYLQDPTLYTVQIALRNFSGTYSSQINTLMAGSIVVLIPAFVIYVLTQRFFIEGIATTGMKL